jgi:carbonic anhydrase
MRHLPDLFESNQRWARATEEAQPGFFASLAAQQSPRYLWVGCSDSRVPANDIVGLRPGELFVHRNVANLVKHTDMNFLSVLQYAVEVLRVEHVIVCGHYGCGGVAASLEPVSHGLIDNWLHGIKDLAERHAEATEGLSREARVDHLCELNVRQQVWHVATTSIVQEAWSRSQSLAVHGWIYRINDGLLRDLDVTLDAPGQVPAIYRLTAPVREGV